jgi:Fe-S-cluster containining protein
VTGDRFLRCGEKTCCTVRTVEIDVGDAARIARLLDVPLHTFATQRERITLAKRPDGAGGGERCIFLLRLGDGTPRCGLGESRPAPCRTFPHDGCTCGEYAKR